MVQIKNVLKQNVKQKGHWNFVDLYNLGFEWFKDNSYHLMEKEYTEKISALGKEIVLIWEAEKKVTDYFKYKISIKWHILGMKDVEAEKDGQKIETNKGDVKMIFTADLIKDYEKRWEDKPLWKFLRGTYDQYIIRTTAEQHEKKLEEDALELISQVKAFLMMGK
ncbi:MAG: hypothetical protein NUV37_01325 [Nanoarchaeota archaeon]|nr:hypothetical protein [Nanoarchaeota archaeon]